VRVHGVVLAVRNILEGEIFHAVTECYMCRLWGCGQRIMVEKYFITL
jgi:hypothetical protein